jgi:predicted nucleic acid-binding protein
MNRIIVLDCTIAASWFMPDEWSSDSQRILSDILERKISMLVPSLWWFEILNILKGALRGKKVNEPTARKALFLLKEIPKDVVDPEKQGQSGILTFSLTENLSAYAATFLHLAVSTGAELFSADSNLLSLRKKHPLIKPPAEYRSLRNNKR